MAQVAPGFGQGGAEPRVEAAGDGEGVEGAIGGEDAVVGAGAALADEGGAVGVWGRGDELGEAGEG